MQRLPPRLSSAVFVQCGIMVAKCAMKSCFFLEILPIKWTLEAVRGLQNSHMKVHEGGITRPEATGGRVQDAGPECCLVKAPVPSGTCHWCAVAPPGGPPKPHGSAWQSPSAPFPPLISPTPVTSPTSRS